MEESILRKRVDDLLAKAEKGEKGSGLMNELFQGALTVMSAVYGQESRQVMALYTTMTEKSKAHPIVFLGVITGALTNLKAELEAGLVGSLRQRMTGEVLTDFIQLARAALDQDGDGAKNVAAVLAAAAFEDTIRRMGTTLAGIIGHDDLSQVINALKEKEILQAPQLGIAQSYLNFRTRALHANWNQVERESVHSVLSFVEQLLLKYFQ